MHVQVKPKPKRNQNIQLMFKFKQNPNTKTRNKETKKKKGTKTIRQQRSLKYRQKTKQIILIPETQIHPYNRHSDLYQLQTSLPIHLLRYANFSILLKPYSDQSQSQKFLLDRKSVV